MYPPDKPFPVYTAEEWWSDDWNGSDYGLDVDFNRSFLDQFFELRNVVPKQINGSVQNENSTYTNFTADSKNCYMVIATENSEDCAYCKLCQGNKDCIDCDYVWDSELNFDCINISNCYGCIGSAKLESSNECNVSFDLKGCTNCTLCYNLRNKQYCYENKQLSEEEYNEKVKALRLNTRSGYDAARSRLLDLTEQKAIHRAAYNVNCERVAGDNLKNCKNMYHCFDLQDSEDCGYGAEGDAISSIDFNNVYYKPEHCIELLSALQCTEVFYSMFIYYSHNVWYSDYCFHGKNLFGCVGLKRGEYCILNKQYSKQEYEELVPRIIEMMKKDGEWGEFFPIHKSPFGYNETVAHEYCPLTKKEVLDRKFKWRDKDPKEYQPQTMEPPEAIEDVQDSITDEVMACSVTGKNYKLTPMELSLYRKMNVPVPRKHPDERHKDRMQFRTPHDIWERTCAKCSVTIKTSYAPARRETVVCDACYEKELY